MIPETIPEGLTFDDVLLVPSRSSIVPAEIRAAHTPATERAMSRKC